MAKACSHIAGIRDVTPSALGCEECLKSGSGWLRLRICCSWGHVGCCDDSPNKHATAHFYATGHPVIEGYDLPEGWGWCYVDEVPFDLSNRKTPHKGAVNFTGRQDGGDTVGAACGSHAKNLSSARALL